MCGAEKDLEMWASPLHLRRPMKKEGEGGFADGAEQPDLCKNSETIVLLALSRKAHHGDSGLSHSVSERHLETNQNLVQIVMKK